ncbi:glycoside hydrolase family 27 protein [Streptomyces sp. NPDC020801]|uniref:glycoside hydrolase family 27 protein n=1 Tax=unclassified Streptomyces TaxID=2593676 RepID=UPI00379BF41A
MGWNSWNAYGCDITAQKIKDAAKAIVDLKLDEAGYKYVVVDDCWAAAERDKDGNLQADTDKFPNGMQDLGDYIHGLGLKFGIYAAPMDKTCAQRPGSKDHEEQDAKTFAAWGVDYLKYDWCDSGGDLDFQKAHFAKMRDALAKATTRPIVYSINPNSGGHYPKTGETFDWSGIANMWRTTEDITNKWDTGHRNDYQMGIRNIVAINSQQRIAEQAGPGHWNDPDMLEVGNGTELTAAEQRTHFSLWAEMAAPLIMGNDLSHASKATLGILGNADVIAVDQDPQGSQGTVVSDTGGLIVMAKPLQNGDVAVTLTNTTGTDATISTTAAGIKIEGPTLTLTDLWEKDTAKKTRTVTDGRISASVPSHGTVMYQVSSGTAGGVPVSASVSAGELTMTMPGRAKADLPAVKFGPAATTSGPLPAIRVRDYRGGSTGWSLTGRLSGDLTSTNRHHIPAADLHWKPTCTTAAGSPTTCIPGTEGPLGTTASTLAAAPDSTGTGTATGGDFTSGAGLTLNVPAYTPTGTYKTTLTLTLS